jgi:hypothetical protein
MQAPHSRSSMNKQPPQQLPVVNDAMQPNAILCPVQCNTLSDLTQVQVPKHQTPVYVFFR